MTYCDWQPTGERKSDGRPVYRCSRCGRRIWGESIAPAKCRKQIDGDEAKPEPRRLAADDLPCKHRGEQITTVPCGLCGGKDRAVPVYRCDVFALAVIEPTARTDKQRIDGTLPQRCVGCGRRE